METTRIVTAVFALSAFAVAVVTGLCTGLSAMDTLFSGFKALFIGAVAGLICGGVLQRVVNEHVAAYAAQNPIPPIERLPVDTAQAVMIVGEADSGGAAGAGADVGKL